MDLTDKVAIVTGAGQGIGQGDCAAACKCRRNDHRSRTKP